MKQFAGLATGLKNDVFLRARLKLTLNYVLVITFILAIFSSLVYVGFSRSFQADVEGSFSSESAQISATSKASTRLLEALILTDGAILVLVAGLGYWLSGKTLYPIKQALESEKQFTADASHELRTPLAVMKTDLEVALRGDGRDINRQLVASNLEEVEKMSVIVADLLSLSRLDAGQEVFNFEKLNLSDLVTRTVNKMNSYAKLHGLTIRLEAKSPLYVRADPLKLQQAILNILRNAIDYSKVGGQVTVTVKKQARLVEVEIKDEGEGIAAKDLPHLFKRFYRAEKSRQHEGSGSGLGLTIAQAIATAHQGNISVTSVLNQGTVVRLSLPRFSIS